MTNETDTQPTMATLSVGVPADMVANLSDAERLSIIVGAAYGHVMAERDEARHDLEVAVDLLDDLVDLVSRNSWAGDNIVVDRAVQFVQAHRTVDSEQAPTQED